MSTVVGYHGCQRKFADGVRSGRIPLARWKPSQNLYDWLGEGIYFFEGSRTRAEQWSASQFGNRADVLEVEIELGQCLNLVESTWHRALRSTYRNLRTIFHSQGWPLPKNRVKRHDLDCLVINKLVELVERGAGQQQIRFQTVRGLFEEGRPVFPGSAIRSESHIQIAVRDIRCMRVVR